MNPLVNNTGVRLNTNVLAFLTKRNASDVDSPNSKSPRGNVSASENNDAVFGLEADPTRVLLSPHEDKKTELETLQESPNKFNLLSENDNTEEKELFKGIDSNMVGTIYDEKPEEIEEILKEKVKMAASSFTNFFTSVMLLAVFILVTFLVFILICKKD